jgi:hypothetical protein
LLLNLLQAETFLCLLLLFELFLEVSLQLFGNLGDFGGFLGI